MAYQRLYVNGRLTAQPLVKRFWMSVKRRKAKECWLWTGHVQNKGYGKIAVSSYGPEHLAHRVSWVLAHGTVPKGLCVLHRCDVPRCVNPAHLFLGTHQDNMTDKMRKNRQTKGNDISHAKLNPALVWEARKLLAAGLSRRDVGAIVGVSGGTIDYLMAGRTWKHVRWWPHG